MINSPDIEDGDLIYVLNGNYYEANQVSVPINISIQGESMAGVTILSAYAGAGEPLFKLEYSTANGDATNGWLGTYGNQTISNLTIDGDSITFSAINVNYRSNVIIDRVTIRDFTTNAIRFYGMDAASWVADNYFESGSGKMPSYWTTGNKVTNCTIINCTQGQAHGQIDIGQQNGIEISNCTITQPIKGSGGNCVGIKYYGDGWNKNTKIHDNIINGTPNPANDYNFSLEMWYELGGCEYYNNTLTTCADFDVAGKGSSTYSIYFHNNSCGPSTYQSTTGTGVKIEATCRDVIIDKNYIHHVQTGIQFSMIWPIGGHADQNSIDRITVTNNKLTNIGKLNSSADWEPIYGINFSDLGNGAGKDSVKNVAIYNNTIVFGQSTPDSYWVTGIFLPNNNIIVNGFTVRNNIIYGFTGGPDYNAAIIGYQEIGSLSVSNFNITNNDFYGNGNLNAILYLNGYTHAGETPVNKTDNPLFTSDYHLTGTSTLIHAGYWVNLTTDLDGEGWANPPTIGCYEYPLGPYLPILTTTTITSITTMTAESGGNISSDNGYAVTARGVCWAIGETPSYYYSHTTNGTGTGIFTSSLTSLTPGATYHVRAYATNSQGTGYGEERIFIAQTGGIEVFGPLIKHLGKFINHGGRFVKIE
jgi:hypothetical protein